ncbi:MAG: succinate--CoA ligase subunit alpha [Candidatus Micrarchaeota archaeon]|nr:succinate--CoA ligase subunit alpha [Candidatus Micrarchaeota archaeon]
MAILVDENTRVVVQGITGSAGQAHAKTMLEFGTKIVAGTKPGVDSGEVLGIPVFSTVKRAVEEKGANASIILVPPSAAKGAALEAIAAGIKLIVVAPEHIPIHDELEIMEAARANGVTVVGPNTAGIIAPSKKCKIGFVPNKYYIPGRVGLMSRSGTLMYEAGSRLKKAGIGESTAIGVGGDMVIGSRFADLLQKFESDPETDVSFIVGEIGGSQEEEAAQLVSSGKIKKPVVAYIVGRSAPKGKRMGHAGAIMSGDAGTMESKINAMREAGINVVSTMDEAVREVAKYAGA